jgi:hypothetical protein
VPLPEQRFDGRRAAALALICAAAVAIRVPPSPAAEAAAAPAADSWNFRVFLNDDPIGYHTFTLTSQGDSRQLTSVAHFQVKILFISAYHYDHQATEAWRGDCLTRLDSNSDDNGRQLSVHARSDEQGISVAAPQGRYTLSGCAMTFAYWNPLMLQQSHLIDPETGDDVAVVIRPVGDELIAVRGAMLPARHYHLHSAKLEIDLWYSPEGRWLALESPSEKGRRLRYVLN